VRRLTFPLVVLVLAGSGWAWRSHSRHVREQTLAAVASQLAGRPVRVHCQSVWGDLFSISPYAGEVRTGPDGRLADVTELRRATCGRLGHLIDDHGAKLECLVAVDWSRVVWRQPLDPCLARVGKEAHVVATLAHESMHLRGFLAEATAQCYAVQETALATVLLGGSRALGEALAKLELVATAGMPTEYQSSECRPGGTLDLHPETPQFPTEAVLAPPTAFGPALR
jgi:hypothetical protein